jgi:hypothetical protein
MESEDNYPRLLFRMNGYRGVDLLSDLKLINNLSEYD